MTEMEHKIYIEGMTPESLDETLLEGLGRAFGDDMLPEERYLFIRGIEADDLSPSEQEQVDILARGIVNRIVSYLVQDSLDVMEWEKYRNG
ncbi:hypothetical protein SEA_CRUNCHYBOI_14 [Microbacterium phage CrunchyBoi]|nr:hypothetical protein SEA_PINEAPPLEPLUTO_14 [Microbacterium phage PineapplePluto]QQO39357.1 hypothetical protein SEA_CRUNCHYBOI_14 [Microbacterium phage CrunchyBoi]